MVKISVVLAALGLALVLISIAPGRADAPAGRADAPAAGDVEYGKALFSAKGCATCHHHAAVAGSGALGGGPPDLTAARWSADYLRRWLQNPAAVKPGTSMPNLGLKSDEIDALIAFLNASAKG